MAPGRHRAAGLTTTAALRDGHATSCSGTRYEPFDFKCVAC